MASRHTSHYLDIGVLGEELVAQWLQSTGWVILHHRWRCRWGEIDIVAHLEEQKSSKHPLLAFVEVKTRSRGNWDAGGLLSISKSKQVKLWRTARCFLATYPYLAEHTCRFDVAVVNCQRRPQRQHHVASKIPTTMEGIATSPSLPMQVKAGTLADYQLLLQEYIPSAFD